MLPVFKFELNHKVIPRVATVGKFDGTHICLTACTGYDKVIIHNPYETIAKADQTQANNEVYELNISQEVTWLFAAQLKPNVLRDLLIIGSPTQLLAYDVHENSDLFFKEVSDGVCVITAGKFSKYESFITVVGGNSSILGFDYEGNEVFWASVGEKVVSLSLFDIDKDGLNELLVGCEGSYIRIFKNDHFIHEFAETGSVTCLCPGKNAKFAYALNNGTVGVYEEGVPLWRVKSKQSAVSIQWSGQSIVTYWDSGRIDWRDINNGQVFKKVQMKGKAASMFLADYRCVGQPDLLALSVLGEVVGYPPYEHGKDNAISKHLPKKTGEKERKAITELFDKKQALLIELQHYQANVNISGVIDNNYDMPIVGSLPANTKLQVTLAHAVSERSIELYVATNNDTIVRAVIVECEGLFRDSDTLAYHPSFKELRTHLRITFKPQKDVPTELIIKAFVGYKESTQYHVFELTKSLPRFSMFAQYKGATICEPNNGYVTFKIVERIQRICMWLNQNFLWDNDIEIADDKTKELHKKVLNLRDGSLVTMDFEADGTVMFTTKDICLAGDFVQSLALFLNLADLQSTAKFPLAEQQLREKMTQASELAETRSRLAATTAERAQLITALLPIANEAVTYDLKDMLNTYNEIVLLNEELIAACHVRRNNHKDATDAILNLHKLIQYAARLRVGKYNKNVVLESRKAIKDDNIEALIRIVSVG